MYTIFFLNILSTFTKLNKIYLTSCASLFRDDFSLQVLQYNVGCPYKNEYNAVKKKNMVVL